MSKDFKNIAKVATATIGSRVIGLVRDSATVAYMSIGAVTSAYTFSFTLPNLFRRLLGEGALTSAMIPIFSQTLKEDGKNQAFDFLNKVVTRAGLLMFIITLLFVAISFALSVATANDDLRFLLGAKYSMIMMPYMMLICLSAVFTSALNVLGSFGIPSITPILLNIIIVIGLFSGVYIFGKDNTIAIGYCMCVAWIVGGFVQMILPALCLYKQGWRFKFDLKKSLALRELYVLFLPALLGAAVYQFNVFVSKLIALFIDDTALPSLYLSSRILEFPLGVFTLAIATVYFPKLANLGSKESIVDFKKTYLNGFIITMAIAVPAMFGIIATSKDILTMLFEWGHFSSGDVNICQPVLITSVCALPFFALSTFATRGFHAKKDTKTPVKASYISFAVNIVLSLLLMKSFGAVGLAAANVIAAIVLAIILNIKLKKHIQLDGEYVEIFKVVIASIMMSIFVVIVRNLLVDYIDGKILSIIVCTTVIPVAVIIYAILLKILNFKRFSNLSTLIKRR